MYKILIKSTFILFFTVISFFSDRSNAHSKIDIKSDPRNEILSIKGENSEKEEKVNLEIEFENSFQNYQGFEDSLKTRNQFLNLFGVNGFPDKGLKQSSFDLWEAFEKEMSNQIGTKKLNGSDINNTYNGSLKTLGN